MHVHQYIKTRGGGIIKYDGKKEQESEEAKNAQYKACKYMQMDCLEKTDVDGAIKSGSKPTTLSSRLQNGLL